MNVVHLLLSASLKVIILATLFHQAFLKVIILEALLYQVQVWLKPEDVTIMDVITVHHAIGIRFPLFLPE
uniref:Putative secreted protein n=1 Tax=Panstrongylus lignarius TaxID=156445 RepID=A0A224Y526_9HEMI